MKLRLSQKLVAWGAVLLFLAVVGVGAAMRSRIPGPHTVTIDAARFEPALSVVKLGESITWINKDLVPHTATARTADFDSGTIEPGKSWTYTPKHTGDLPYFCVFHPTMTALLRVK